MIFAIVIPPSGLGKLLEECVRVLLGAALGEVQYQHIDKASSLSLDLAQDPRRHLLVAANAPNDAIARQLIENRIPTLALVDDPKEIVRYFKATYQSTFGKYIRRACACFAQTHDIVVDLAECVLDQRIYSVRIRRLIEWLASFYKLPLNDRFPAMALRKLAPQLAPGEDCSVAALLERRLPEKGVRLSQFEEDLVEACMGPFGSMAVRKPVGRVVWPGALFSPASDIQTYSKQVDLIGRARIVICGPSLYLPGGRWKAISDFGVDHNDSGNILIIDIYNGKTLVEGRCILPPKGEFSSELAFEVTEPHRPLEVRFATGQGAIEGVFELEKVVIERI